MSHGAFVHADRLERQALAERRQAEHRELRERRRQWAARNMPDLPTENVVVNMGILESGGWKLTAELIRACVEAHLLRFYTPAELAAMKANGGELPEPVGREAV